MNTVSGTEMLAEKLEKIKSILKFRCRKQLKNVWDRVIDKKTSLGCWWYEIKDGEFEWSDKGRHNSIVFQHIWKNRRRRQWIRGHVFRMEDKNGLFFHVEDFYFKDTSGSVLAAMARKVTKVTGYPLSVFVDERGRIWGQV